MQSCRLTARLFVNKTYDMIHVLFASAVSDQPQVCQGLDLCRFPIFALRVSRLIPDYTLINLYHALVWSFEVCDVKKITIVFCCFELYIEIGPTVPNDFWVCQQVQPCERCRHYWLENTRVWILKGVLCRLGWTG